MDELLLSVAKTNSVTKLVTTTAAAAVLHGMQLKRPAKLGGVEVEGVDLMAEVLAVAFAD